MVKIISDSTCDLSAELAAQYDIDILPLHILLGDEEFEDGKTITPDEIYSWSDEHKTTPKTSAPSLAETIELFRPYVEDCLLFHLKQYVNIRQCHASCCRGTRSRKPDHRD